jgi:hypothetical protein
MFLPACSPCFCPAPAAAAGQPRLMESALLIFACLARYVMPILTQYMATLNGVLQVGGWLRGVDHFVWLSCIMNV